MTCKIVTLGLKKVFEYTGKIYIRCGDANDIYGLDVDTGMLRKFKDDDVVDYKPAKGFKVGYKKHM